MRASIKALNAAHHVPDEPMRGYHETTTHAWMRLVQVTLCEYGPATTADEFFEQNPQLSQKKILRLFYSRERFMLPEAKVKFIEPDLTELPKHPSEDLLEVKQLRPNTEQKSRPSSRG